jgi:ubiquinone/menaquinone biosynthesis C-methylase UbiE
MMPQRERRSRPSAVPAIAAVLGMMVWTATPAAAQTQARHGRLFAPQDLGLLETPDRDAWQKPAQIMDALGIADGAVVADLGAGGGWFTIRLARRVGPNGTVWAEDVQRLMIEAIERRVQREGLRNVRTVTGTADDPGLPAGALDAVLIVDAFHEMEEPVALLRNVARALKPQGRLGIIDYRKGEGGPGPPPDERIAAEVIVEAAKAAGLRVLRQETFLPFEYFLVLGRP